MVKIHPDQSPGWNGKDRLPGEYKAKDNIEQRKTRVGMERTRCGFPWVGAIAPKIPALKLKKCHSR